MVNKEANYDKVLLTIAALAALGVAAYLFTLKSSFSEKLVLTRSTPKADFGDIPVEKVTASVQRLGQVFNWVSPIKQNKPVPLNKSVTVVLKDGELFDLYLEEKKLREPMTNQYLRDFELEYLSPNVAYLDPDGDGFSNVEEFTKNTNPRKAESHPPLTDKLYFKERVQENYIVVLQSSEMPLQVKRMEPVAPSQFIEIVPRDFGFDRGAQPRFTAEKYERKSATGPTGLPKDLSELTVLDKSTGDRFVLILKEPKNLAAFEAKMEFRVGQVSEYRVQKGGTFRINGIAATFKVIEVTEESATIAELDASGQPGKPFVVNRRQ
jgi:hypothetical protein